MIGMRLSPNMSLAMAALQAHASFQKDNYLI